MSETIYNNRFLARIILEAKTPLAVGSGEKSLTTDAEIARDVNGMPYIPGTAIAGVIRHALGENEAKEFFGYQQSNKNDGRGSEIIFSDAVMIGKEGKVLDGLLDIDPDDTFYHKFFDLPIRQHVRINHFGTAENNGKFDERILFKGVRFCFEVEQLAKNEDDYEAKFKKALSKLFCKDFRLGGGTRNGFGEMKIISCKTAKLDLSNAEDLRAYLSKDSSLASEWPGFKDEFSKKDEDKDVTVYKLTLRPDDFFLFGSGFGDDDADMIPVKEDVVTWNAEGKPSFKKNCILIPATSVKGALSHRVAYYYNKAKEVFADDLSEEEMKGKTGKHNFAVKSLFGSEKDKDSSQTRGNVIFSDIIEDSANFEDKILNHVSIDRFTGGAIDGALFSEKATYGKGKSFATSIIVENKALKDEDVKNALENALKDIVSGMLPLGGGVNRGNGCFTGEITKNDKPFI